MTARVTRPKCLLLDSNVIIKAYELGIWSQLICNYEVVIPTTISHCEALYYNEPKGKKKKIDLPDQVSKGIVSELEAVAGDLTSLFSVFAPWFIDVLHSGEAEALALIQMNKVGEAYFCTSDASAIQALAMLHKSHLGISFESVLSKIGVTKVLNHHFRDEFFRKHVRIGQINLVTGEGLTDTLRT